MEIAIGLTTHSGWAALVAVGFSAGSFLVLDRRRIELVEPAEAHWAKQPYHAAEGLAPGEARKMVKRGIDSARRLAIRELQAALERAREMGQEVVACALLVGESMPDWSVREILAVHFRMHKAEGVLFREALLGAAEACRLRTLAIPEKLLTPHAERALAATAEGLYQLTAVLGKSVGAPWGKDQKDAALAAIIALKTHHNTHSTATGD